MPHLHLSLAILASSLLVSAQPVCADPPAIPLSAPKVAAPTTAATFPEAWFWRIGATAAKHVEMTGKPALALALTDWRGAEQDLAKLKGSIVVIDFWATWCPPCRAAIPENVAMSKELAEKGVVIIGAHEPSRGVDKLDAMIAEKGMTYSNAVATKATITAWNVSFYPTYAIVDREGIVRAIGLQPEFVRPAVEALLSGTMPDATSAAPATKEPAASARSELLEGDSAHRAAMSKLEALDTAPALDVSDFANGDAVTLAALKGKVVVLDFWATWCGPCIASIPKNNALAEQYAKAGVVFIGVCAKRGSDKMLDTIKDRGISYLCCVDPYQKTAKAYGNDGFPDYHIIGRDGKVFAADVRNGSVEDAIKLALASK
ncbi:MAG: TlpA family protein disulfide reductase [Phycisphaerales bacterium]|nr:TlpA family protein disulfide reductase [Phycisphaerales bacterium]